MEKNYDVENLIHFKTFDDLIKAVGEAGYTMTPRQICRLLKVHRSWYDSNIKPHILYTYVSNGIRGEYFEAMYMSHLRECVAARYPDVTIGCVDPEGKPADFDQYSSILINKESVFECILNADFSAARQVIPINFKWLLTPAEYHHYFDKLYKPDMERSELIDVFKNRLPDLPNHVIHIVSNRGHITHRGACEWIPVTTPDLNTDNFIDVISTWVAPRDLKGYGDTDEQVSRKFFSSGAIRLIGNFVSKDGEVKEKTLYYFPDDAYHGTPFPYGIEESSLLVPYAIYQKYEGMILSNKALYEAEEKLV